MGIRPLDLQVNINSIMETSKDQGLKQASLMQEQRIIDGHIVDDAKHRSEIVNEVPKKDRSEELEDAEKHFGNKTEAELEQEYSEDDKKEEREQSSDSSKNKKAGPDENHHIDTLA